MSTDDVLSHPLSAPGVLGDGEASFYRFAMGRCGAAAVPVRTGAWRTAPRGRSSLIQHFKLKHRAGRGLAHRMIKRLLDDRS